MLEKIREFVEQKKWRKIKKSDWIVLALTGVLILILAMPTGEKQTTVNEQEQIQTETEPTLAEAVPEWEEEAYTTYLEERLEEVLGEMEGVGKVKVMITFSDSGESIVEKDYTDSSNTVTENDSSGGTRTTTEQENSTNTVYVENGEETYPYIGKEVLPTIKGVVVVAEGGGNPTVVSDISDAVMALFPVEAHRIKVVKMSSKEE